MKGMGGGRLRSTEVATVFWPFLDAQKLAGAEAFQSCRVCSCSTSRKWSQGEAPEKCGPDKVQKMQISSGTHRLR